MARALRPVDHAPGQYRHRHPYGIQPVAHREAPGADHAAAFEQLMPSFANLTSVMFGTVFSTFGEPVTLMQDEESCTLTGIFRADAEAVDVSAGVPVSTVQTVLELREADLPFWVEEGDVVVIQQRCYHIVDVRPDGHGILKLLLHQEQFHE